MPLPIHLYCCNKFLQFKKEELKVNAYTTLKNRLNQINGYLNGKELITDFKGNSGRAYLKQMVLDPKVQDNKKYTAIRFRRILNNLFDFILHT